MKTAGLRAGAPARTLPAQRWMADVCCAVTRSQRCHHEVRSLLRCSIELPPPPPRSPRPPPLLTARATLCLLSHVPLADITCPTQPLPSPYPLPHTSIFPLISAQPQLLQIARRNFFRSHKCGSPCQSSGRLTARGWTPDPRAHRCAHHAAVPRRA